MINGIYATSENKQFFNVGKVIEGSKDNKSSETTTTKGTVASNSSESTASMTNSESTSSELVSSTVSSESKTEEIKKKNDATIDVPKSIESNSDGLVTVKGKVTSDEIKQIIVKNSLDDQEKTVDIQSDLSFSFDIQMNDASNSLILRLCNSDYRDELSANDWKTISVQANTEFHQKYIDRLTNDMENMEDSST